MENKSIAAFKKYYTSTREATNRVIAVIPPDKMDWSYLPGKFTIADLLRHIAAIERQLFMEVVSGRKPTYQGCGKELADGHQNVVSFFHDMHRQSMEILDGMQDEDLLRAVRTLDGRIISAGNFLRALVIHEVHHRGALCIYLNLLGIKTPPIIGLMEADVIQLSATYQVVGEEPS
jgi:uncharacterized damage-inducible protein DinB